MSGFDAETAKKQALSGACASIATIVESPEYQKAPWKYFQTIIDILNKHSIVPASLTPLERNQLMGSFKVENVVDNIGTSSAIATYIVSMMMIHQGQNLGGFMYNTFTGIGMLFSFGCALSFTSSSFDLLQEYRRVHFRLKLVEYHQTYMILMLRLWLNTLSEGDYTTHAPAILSLLTGMAEQQVQDLKRESEILQLLQNSEFLSTDYEEHERVAQEISDIDAKVTVAQQNIKKLNKIDTQHKPKDNIENDVRDHANRINDILHAPLYNVSLNKDNQHDASVSSRYATLSSTSLYAKRYGHIKNLAAYCVFAMGYKVVASTDEQLARFFLTKDNRARFNIPDDITSDSKIFSGCLDLYNAKQKKLNVYLGYPAGSKKPATYLASLQIQYLQIQQELEIVDEQIQHHEDELKALSTAMMRQGNLNEGCAGAPPARSSAASIDNKPISQNKTLLSEPYVLRPLGNRTSFMWKAEWEELKGFFLLIKEGIGIGVKQMMTPDEEKYLFRTKIQKYSPYHPRLWTYHIKKRIKNLSPGMQTLATVLFVAASIPYFIYYALKHFSHLLDGLQTVVDGIHKSVRDVDRALSYHSGDDLRFVLTYPLKVAWALITFIPETLGGMAYWTLTATRSLLMKSDYNVAQTSRAINPRWLANWVEKQYMASLKYKAHNRPVYNITVTCLYFVTLLGGVYNTFASLIAKIIPFYPARDEHIRASRDQLKIAWQLFENGMITGYRYLIEDPITSNIKQSMDEHYRLEAKYDFKTYPLRSAAGHVYIAVKFIASFITNVLLLGTYRSIKGLAKTAPVITATVVVSSTLMPGITLPFFSFSFAAATQVKMAVLAMCGDCTNGSHDMYNLANSLKRRYRLRFIEHAALSMLKDKTDLAGYKRWLSVFDHIDVGQTLFDSIEIAAKQETHPKTYVKHHLDVVLTKRKDWVARSWENYQEMALQLLAHQLACYCMDHHGSLGEKTVPHYEKYYDNLKKDASVISIAKKIADTLPAKGKLNTVQTLNYIAGMSVLAGFDLSRSLMSQLRDNYQTQKRVDAHQVNLEKGLADVAQKLSQAPQKTCLLSRGAPIKETPQFITPKTTQNIPVIT